ncbi:MAG TPA: cytidine deaminase [Longimicrobiaceae bacterium]|nr:cytidine deaminase [Longimicrobiaceae bacterium]
MGDSSLQPAPGLDATAARALLDRARAARANAYAPYSRFPVGAALLTDDGRVFTGVNVENASYGLATCAERAAVARAVAEGARSFRAVAVAGPEDDVACPPCGSCRQILHEFGPEMAVVTAGEQGEPRIAALPALLPDAFGAAHAPPPGEPWP